MKRAILTLAAFAVLGGSVSYACCPFGRGKKSKPAPIAVRGTAWELGSGFKARMKKVGKIFNPESVVVLFGQQDEYCLASGEFALAVDDDVETKVFLGGFAQDKKRLRFTPLEDSFGRSFCAMFDAAFPDAIDSCDAELRQSNFKGKVPRRGKDKPVKVKFNIKFKVALENMGQLKSVGANMKYKGAVLQIPVDEIEPESVCRAVDEIQ